MAEIHSKAEKISALDTSFKYSQIICGNEAFPESAVSDPIADLEVWDEWRSGMRYFPYTGRYSKLGISRQEEKTSSSSSVGVLGEIMAGYFAQVGVSPRVLVRVVRRWPDFIFSHGDKTYSFVEAKAFTQNPRGDYGLPARVLNLHVSEGAVDTVQQLNSDPFGKVWYAMTRIVSIRPMVLEVTMLELVVPSIRRQRHQVKSMPQSVVDGLAKRAINQAAASLVPDEYADLEKQPKHRILEVPQKIERLAEQEIDSLLDEAGAEVTDEEDRRSVQTAISKMLTKLQKKKLRRREEDEVVGRRFLEAKETAAEGRFSKLRQVSDKWLLIADLAEEQRITVKQNWSSNWERASAPWGILDGVELWRCGGAVFCYANENMEGRSVLEAEIVR